jgi:hypothetical protein
MFWIILTVLTTASVTAVSNPINIEVFAQGNDRAEMMEYSGNMTSTTNATLTDDCEENMTLDECDTGSISRQKKK